MPCAVFAIPIVANVGSLKSWRWKGLMSKCETFTLGLTNCKVRSQNCGKNVQPWLGDPVSHRSGWGFCPHLTFITSDRPYFQLWMMSMSNRTCRTCSLCGLCTTRDSWQLVFLLTAEQNTTGPRYLIYLDLFVAYALQIPVVRHSPHTYRCRCHKHHTFRLSSLSSTPKKSFRMPRTRTISYLLLEPRSCNQDLIFCDQVVRDAT